MAGRQHWVLHRRQILAGAVGPKGIRGRVHRRQLHPVLSDVYLYGRTEPEPLSLAMAAALHFRGDALISHELAAWLWDFSDQRPPDVPILLAGRSTTRPPGVTLHRVAAVHPDDIRWRKGLPVTSPARSFCDFAGRVSLPRVESGLAMLRRQHHHIDSQLRSTLDRLPANHRGAPLVRRLLELPPGQLVLTKSVYERKLRALLKAADLPQPLSNHVIAGRERDLVWPEQRLIIEFDGWEFHKERFLEDRRRDGAAVAAGWRVIRLTADRVDDEPFHVIAEIAAALAHH